ncbi:MAG: pyridoxal-dependent decarboxylase [Bacteroidota bacterium]
MQNNPQDFRAISEVVIEKLQNYLAESQTGKGKVLVQQPITQLAQSLELEKWIRNGGFTPDSVRHFLDTYLSNTQHMHHPHYIGHQVAVPHVASGLADFIHGVVNNPMAIYEMGPAASAIEHVIINWMLEKVGWFDGEHLGDFQKTATSAGGVLTHGGSAANLTALLAARAAIAPDAWVEGNPDDLVVLGSEVAHYCIARSISIMGLGKNAFRPVAVNNWEVLKPEDLRPTYQRAKDDGKRVMAVVANACATATGLYDPIDEIGCFCEENGLWFHVDGAHGASALVSPNQRHYLKGIERANSIVWDTHKMLRTSTLSAAILFKNYQTLTTTFQQKGSYLFYEKEAIGFDIISHALECTKAGLGTKLFWVLAAEGEQGMAQFIDTQYDNTKKFRTIINEHPDFNCPYETEANIICFLYTKYGVNNDFQLALQNEVVKRGNYYITSSEVRGVRYLRLTVMNPLTQEAHIQGMMQEVVEVAASLHATV